MRRIILLIIYALTTTMTFAQEKKIERIEIWHSYEDLYSLYIVPASCDFPLNHGPIVLTDSISISIICEFLSAIEQLDEDRFTDTRFRIEFFSKDEISVLCFGRPKLGMIYQNRLFKYNDPLCSHLISIIKESGAIEPKKIRTPQLSSDDINSITKIQLPPSIKPKTANLQSNIRELNLDLR